MSLGKSLVDSFTLVAWHLNNTSVSQPYISVTTLYSNLIFAIYLATSV